MAASDQALLDRWVRQRDAEAFKLLCSQYTGMAYATGLRILRNEAEAEDVAQECFEHLAGIVKAPKGHFGPWLHKVVTNRALMRIRGEKRRKRREEEFGRSHDGHARADHADIYPYVDEAVAALPEKLRRAVVLHFLEDRTHDEIARLEGVSRPAITQRVQRGIDRVRKSLARRGVEVGSVTLAGVLASATSAATPESLTVALGKLAIAGGSSTGVLPTATPALAWTVEIFAMKAKVTSGLALIALLVAVGVYSLAVRPEVHPPPPKEDLPPVETRVEQQVEEAPVIVAVAEEELAGPVLALEVLEDPADSEVEVPSPEARISGVVVSAAGAPILGAEVYASRNREEGEDRAVLLKQFDRSHYSHTRTAGDGTFEISGIESTGDFSVTAQAPGYGSSSGKVTVRAGEENAQVSLILSDGVNLRGRLLTHGGAPITDAVVSPCVGSRDTEWASTGFTDPQGYFTMAATLRTAVPQEPITMTLAVRSESLGTALFRDVVFGEDRTVELRMRQPAALSGTIVYDDGSPARGLLVRVRPAWPLPPPFEGYFARGRPDSIAHIDEAGYYEIAGLDPAVQYAAYIEESYLKPFTPEIMLTLEPGPETIWDRTLARTMVVYGQVVGELSGEPIEGSYVSHKRPPDTTAFNAFEASADVDAQGNYELRIGSPGTYSVAAVHSRSEWYHGITDWYGKEVTLQSGDRKRLDFTLPDPDSLSILVVDADGNPLEGAYTGWGTTGEDGLATRSVHSGKDHDVRIILYGYIEETRKQLYSTPFGEEPSSTTVVLYECSGVEGYAVFSDGSPAAFAALTLDVAYADGRHLELSVLTNSEGRFALAQEVPATEVAVSVSLDSEDGLGPYTWKSDTVACWPGHVTMLEPVVLERSQ